MSSPRNAGKRSARGGASGRGLVSGSPSEKSGQILGYIALAFFVVSLVGILLGISPVQMWQRAQNLPGAIGATVDSARCALNTCPKVETADALDKLAVAPEKDGATYKRAEFGASWADVDHNGCDTRQDILARDMRGVTTTRVGACDHIVTGGTLEDPYTGLVVTAPRDVQPDHIVSLGEAWRSGAAAWTPAQRLAYANDPTVLQGTAGSVNEAKSDYDVTHAWKRCVQRNAAHRCVQNVDARPTGARACTYAKKVVEIKAKYALSVDPAEKAALRQDLGFCTS